MIEVMIRQAARRQGIISPAELARVVRVRRAVAGRWWGWKSGDGPTPTLESLDKICAALDCELSDLVRRIKRKRAHVNGRSRRKP